jgi:hypothetical protein
MPKKAVRMYMLLSLISLPMNALVACLVHERLLALRPPPRNHLTSETHPLLNLSAATPPRTISAPRALILFHRGRFIGHGIGHGRLRLRWSDDG